ncbi:hypothetical protein ACH0B5_04630 [Ureibacillus sp. 179-F W5.1 NHS]|uniref:hypothetical protein n=1 Tax=Ureibacillus sp. 179-F W5.1 NHS TaxID=3374297 RepID=UPI00387A453A
MIRKLTEKDREKVMNFVLKKPAENLFIIGDIEAYGFETEFQTVWGQFNEYGELMAVLFKYEGNYIPYAEGDINCHYQW